MAWSKELVHLFAGDRASEILEGRNGLVGEESPLWTIDRIDAFIAGALRWTRALLLTGAAVSAWLLLLRRSPRRWRLLIASGVAVVAVAGVVTLAGFWQARGAAFEVGAARLTGRSEEVARMIAEEPPHERLRNLAPSPVNGSVYRFDDHVEEARVETGGGSRKTDSAGPIFELRGGDPDDFICPAGTTILDRGALQLAWSPGHVLESSSPMGLSGREVSAVEIRFRSASGGDLTVGFSRDPNVGWEDQDRIESLRIPTIGDGEPHTYRVDLATALHDVLASGARIEKLFLVPSDIPGDLVELDWIRFLGPAWKYRGTPITVAYDSLDRELRRLIAFRLPARLSFDVEIPERNPGLSFGLGMATADEPGRFTVRIGEEDQTATVYSATVGPSDGWVDTVVDLSSFAGQRTSITLIGEGTGGVAFWSHPMVYGTPRRPMRIVVILEDALRADHLGAWGFERPTSPFRDRLWEAGVRFEHAFSQATATRPSVPSLMTSLYPTATGVWSLVDRLGDRWVTLAVAGGRAGGV